MFPFQHHLIDAALFYLPNRRRPTNNSGLGFFRVIGGSFGDIVFELVRRLAVVYFIFAIYAWFKGIAFNNAIVRKIWLIYFLTNLLLLFSFGIFNSFLVSRYTLASVLTLLLLAPIAIDTMLRNVGECLFSMLMAT